MLKVGSVVLAVVLALSGVSAVSAHDVWITVEQNQRQALQAVIHHGHPGDRKAPDPDKLFELRMIEPDGQDAKMPPVAAPGMRDGFPVLLPSSIQTKGQTGTWLLAACYDNGYWVKTEFGHRNTSKAAFPSASESLHSMKFAKALVSVGKPTPMAYARVVGHRLELVPLDDPFSVPIGGTLHVRVLFEGKPVAGIGVEIGDGMTPRKEEEIPRYPTDREGVAEIPIAQSGLQLIVVDYAIASRHPDLADKELMASTLSFVVK